MAWIGVGVKLQSMLLLKSFCLLLFRLVGWECLGPVLLLLCVVSGGYPLSMEDLAGGQPAANPAEERESSTFSEASVNQQPVIPELEPTLLDENTRRAELALQLRSNWWGCLVEEANLVGQAALEVVAQEKHFDKVFGSSDAKGDWIGELVVGECEKLSRSGGKGIGERARELVVVDENDIEKFHLKELGGNGTVELEVEEN